MKSYQRIFIFLLIVLLVTGLLSPWAATLWDMITRSNPEWHPYRYSFSSIFSRLFMILGILLFFLCRPLLRLESMMQVALQPVRSGYPDLLRGFGTALASLVILGLAMSLAEVFDPYFRLSTEEALARCFKALMAALTVGFLEEIFFRGMLFKGLLEDWKPLPAFVAVNLFYSAIHFVKPTERIALSDVHPWVGLEHIVASFRPLLEPGPLLPGLVGLFLIGGVLSYALLRTGSLYLSIGLHAGWIFGLKTVRVFGDYRREDLGWLFGASEPKIVTGAAAWIGILAVGLVVQVMTRNRQPLKLDRS